MTVPLARPPTALPRGTVPGLPLGSPGSVAHLFPEVTPAPAAPGAGRGRPGPSGGGGVVHTALTADTGVISGGQGRLIVLAVTIAAGIAAAGAWLTVAGPGRRAVSSLAGRLGRRPR